MTADELQIWQSVMVLLFAGTLFGLLWSAVIRR